MDEVEGLDLTGHSSIMQQEVGIDSRSWASVPINDMQLSETSHMCSLACRELSSGIDQSNFANSSDSVKRITLLDKDDDPKMIKRVRKKATTFSPKADKARKGNYCS
jgi:hypothetical protein